jgi:hypothetical protein
MQLPVLSAQQQTLPKDPPGLGKGWKDVTPQGGKNPKIPKRFQGPKGTEIEFDPANPNASSKTWAGNNHWHEVDPETGKRKDGHLEPGEAMPGPDGAPEPAHAPEPGATSSPFSAVGNWASSHRGALIGAAVVTGAILLAPETGGASLILVVP